MRAVKPRAERDPAASFSLTITKLDLDRGWWAIRFTVEGHVPKVMGEPRPVILAFCRNSFAEYATPAIAQRYDWQHATCVESRWIKRRKTLRRDIVVPRKPMWAEPLPETAR